MKLTWLLTVLAFVTPVAFGQPYEQTWASSTGSDTPSCGERSSPCRTLTFAIFHVADGGDVQAVDPADSSYLDIGKPLTIDGRGLAVVRQFPLLQCESPTLVVQI